jgi:glycosyltransferase involved in cell wall biosynthesis
MPKISIVIPVYNVEKYLAECLNSVLAQTLTDIEIICVNDGSPDRSAEILQQYAERDKRIMIINKENGGLSSARNAAYPHIRGKYTLFVDSDDWIEPDLCETTYAKAEETNAPMTVFFYGAGEYPEERPCWSFIMPGDKTTVTEKSSIINYPMTWSKLFRTDFLWSNRLNFAEGLIYEDELYNWQTVILANKISVIPEQLYHYRYNENSITGSCGKRSFDIIEICERVRSFLEESGHIQEWQDKYCVWKLSVLAHKFNAFSVELKHEFKERIRNVLTEEDRRYFRNGRLERHIARLYAMEIDGGVLDHYLYETLQMFRRLEPAVRYLFKPVKKKAA